MTEGFQRIIGSYKSLGQVTFAFLKPLDLFLDGIVGYEAVHKYTFPLSDAMGAVEPKPLLLDSS